MGMHMEVETRIMGLCVRNMSVAAGEARIKLKGAEKDWWMGKGSSIKTNVGT